MRGDLWGLVVTRSAWPPEALIQRNEDRNLSVSLALVERSGALLLWNLSGPCRLAAQVWPCRPGQAGPHHSCKEIRGLRNASRLETSNWRQTQEGRWVRAAALTLYSLNKCHIAYLSRFIYCIIIYSPYVLLSCVVSSSGDIWGFQFLRP